jgi:hypothetical protein
MIAALQISLDGFTQGEDRGEPEWVDSWADALGLIPEVDAFVKGAGMYPGYGEFWAGIYADPKRDAPFMTRPPLEREVAYANFAVKTPHYILSKTLKGVSWPPTAKIVGDVSELQAIKNRPGKNIYVVGGASIVTTLLKADLLDELRLILHPLLLGGGKSLFAGVTRRRPLKLVNTDAGKDGKVILTYRTQVDQENERPHDARAR